MEIGLHVHSIKIAKQADMLGKIMWLPGARKWNRWEQTGMSVLFKCLFYFSESDILHSDSNTDSQELSLSH